MTVKDKITDVYRKLTEGREAEAVDCINELLFASKEKDLREYGCDLYMLIRLLKSTSGVVDEDLSSYIDELMDKIALYVVSLDKPRLVEIQDNDSLDTGIFVDSLSKLQEPYTVVERQYITNNYLHFSEFIYKDVRGIKYRRIELPQPPDDRIISGYELTNGLLMEREDNLKLLFEEDE